MSQAAEPKREDEQRGLSLARLGFYAALALFAGAAGFLSARLLSGAGGHGDILRPVTAGDSSGIAVPGFGRLIERKEPSAAPDLAFAGADGSPHRISDWRGKVVLVNLWATWCAPCKAEMPSLDRLQAKLGADKLTVLPISVDRSGPDKPAAFFAANGIANLAVYNDVKAEALTAFGASGLPLSVILDGQGREVARLIGPADWDSPETAAQIGGILKRYGSPG
ncbi:MAG: TlpA family protein disulfide reductase [Rhodomicrobium sp.]